MIIGIGIDIIDNRRIKRVLEKYGSRFINKCFTKKEIEKSEKFFLNTNSYAKRYSAKEACAKALGTGLARGIFWKDIEVVNDIYGKPNIKLYNKALTLADELSKSNYKIELSLSDEVNYSIANVIIFKNNEFK